MYFIVQILLSQFTAFSLQSLDKHLLIYNLIIKNPQTNKAYWVSEILLSFSRGFRWTSKKSSAFKLGLRQNKRISKLYTLQERNGFTDSDDMQTADTLADSEQQTRSNHQNKTCKDILITNINSSRIQIFPKRLRTVFNAQQWLCTENLFEQILVSLVKFKRQVWNHVGENFQMRRHLFEIKRVLKQF